MGRSSEVSIHGTPETLRFASNARTNDMILVSTEYRCEPFPFAARCKENGQAFCIAWNTAGYASQLSLVFAAGALMTITLANITTKKRRRTAWKIVSSLTGIHGALSVPLACITPHEPYHFLIINRSSSNHHDGFSCISPTALPSRILSGNRFW